MYRFVLIIAISFLSCSGSITYNDAEKLSGGKIIALLNDMPLNEREEKIFELVKENNVPAFILNFSEVEINEVLNGNSYNLKFYAAPDYFALGTNEDYFLIPMTPILAQKIADFYDAMLPTSKMVDLIYQSAKVKYYPQPIKPSAEMITIKVFAFHNDSIKMQRERYFNSLSGVLSSGHKKDVIISNKIYADLKQNVPKPVVIYGWHKPDGKPIQPVYNGHGEKYADYSHGIRLIKKYAILNGEKIFIDEILRDSLLCKILSDEGVIEKYYYTVD